MKLSVASEVDLLLLERILTENGIEFSRRPSSPSALLGFGINEPQEIEIQVPSNQSEETAQEDMSSKRQKRRRKIFVVLLSVYAAVVSILLLKYWDLSRKDGGDPNYVSEWDFSNTMLKVAYKKDSSIYNLYFDRDYDGSYEIIESFVKDRMLSKSSDNDRNGIYERQEFFAMDGRSLGVSIDRDQDAIFDSSTTVLQNGETLHFVDRDKDAQYEMIDPN